MMIKQSRWVFTELFSAIGASVIILTSLSLVNLSTTFPSYLLYSYSTVNYIKGGVVFVWSHNGAVPCKICGTELGWFEQCGVLAEAFICRWKWVASRSWVFQQVGVWPAPILRRFQKTVPKPGLPTSRLA